MSSLSLVDFFDRGIFNMTITKNEIKNGLRKGFIKLITDPNMESGTVCQIEDNWFYFGGPTAEDMTPEEYRKNIPEEDIVNEIFDTLDAFRKDRYFLGEYEYYASLLHLLLTN